MLSHYEGCTSREVSAITGLNESTVRVHLFPRDPKALRPCWRRGTVSMLNRLGLNRHVTDADLVAVWTDNRLGELPRTAAGTHVRECAACRTRLASLRRWLDGVRNDARQEADEAFPRERLAAQQAQILRRLEAMERPARVLVVPPLRAGNRRPPRRPSALDRRGRRSRPARWHRPGADRSTSDARSSLRQHRRRRNFAASSPMGVQRISLTTDEDFLYDSLPAATEVPESLRSLHEITPSAREYDPR